MYTLPGKKLLFMGSDFGQMREWNHDQALDWPLLDDPMHAGLHRWVRDLNTTYRGIPALHEQDCHPDGFQWVEVEDRDRSVFAYLRKARHSDDQVLVACNFTPVPRHNYRLGVPRSGPWQEVLNGDARLYGGSGQGNLGSLPTSPVSVSRVRSGSEPGLAPSVGHRAEVPHMSTWQPSLGAWFDDEEARFRVWAPDASSVKIRLESPAPSREIPMMREFQGYHTQRIGGLEPGDRYHYLVDDQGPFPDPASRWQPEGVHGPSALVDPSRYLWNDESFTGVGSR